MIKNLIKLIAMVSLGFVTYAMAAESASVNFTGITKANLGNDGGPAFSSGGNALDDFNVKFKATVDNVEANINFGDDTSGNGKPVLEFQSATLKVSDLLDGMLDLTFYDVGHGAGKGSAILPDWGAHGVKLDLKPMDLLTVGFKYGINNGNGLNTANGAAIIYSNELTPRIITTTNSGVNTTTNAGGNMIAKSGIGSTGNGDVHLLALSIGVNLDILPFTIHAGAILKDRKARERMTVETGGGANFAEESKIHLMNAGITLDALAALKPGVLKIDFGMALAGNLTTDESKSLKAADTSEKLAKGQTNDGIAVVQNKDFVIVAHGGVSDIIEGLSLDYSLHYAPDSLTKHKTLGNAGDTFFKENIKVSLTPSYVLGSLKIALGMTFSRYGKNAALHYNGYVSKAETSLLDAYTSGSYAAYSKLDLDPSVTWTIASGMSVKFFYELDYTLGGDSLFTADSKENIASASVADAVDHTIGMTTSITLGLSGAEAEAEEE